MEKQKMNYFFDFFEWKKKRNQNNVVQFPGKENRELSQQKNDLAALVVELEKRLTGPIWELQPFHDKELEMLANFGEGLTFSPLTSQRLIANLAGTIFKLRQNLEDPF